MQQPLQAPCKIVSTPTQSTENQLSNQATKAVVWRCSAKKVFLKISQNSQENTCASLFFNKVAGLSLQIS